MLFFNKPNTSKITYDYQFLRGEKINFHLISMLQNIKTEEMLPKHVSE